MKYLKSINENKYYKEMGEDELKTEENFGNVPFGNNEIQNINRFIKSKFKTDVFKYIKVYRDDEYDYLLHIGLEIGGKFPLRYDVEVFKIDDGWYSLVCHNLPNEYDKYYMADQIEGLYKFLEDKVFGEYRKSLLLWNKKGELSEWFEEIIEDLFNTQEYNKLITSINSSNFGRELPTI